MSEDEKKAIDMLEKYITEHKLYNIKQSDGLEDNIKILLDLYKQEKEKNKELFEEYNKRVGTIIKYEQAIKSFFDGTNITDIEPWTIYKIKGELLFELEELLEED